MPCRRGRRRAGSGSRTVIESVARAPVGARYVLCDQEGNIRTSGDRRPLLRGCIMPIVNPSTRIFVLIARKTRVGVIFRRGPSSQVLLIKWNLERDIFETGQWFKGRVYERRCDLSPEGDMLLYFAANWRKPYRSWSAISRPPFFTALALWPKGDGWGGGGQFLSRDCIELNHRKSEMTLAHDFSLPNWLSVKPFGVRPGWGEDDPIWFSRLRRDGWTLVAFPERTKDEFGARVGIEFDPPIKLQKAHPLWPKKYFLQLSILGMKKLNGSWYLIEHSVNAGNASFGSLGRSDWADWDPNGDLLFARSGCLFRLGHQNGILKGLDESQRIVDFSTLRFESKASPTGEWPSRIARP